MMVSVFSDSGCSINLVECLKTEVLGFEIRCGASMKKPEIWVTQQICQDFLRSTSATIPLVSIMGGVALPVMPVEQFFTGIQKTFHWDFHHSCRTLGKAILQRIKFGMEYRYSFKNYCRR